MKQLVLIITIVFSGMLMQGQAKIYNDAIYVDDSESKAERLLRNLADKDPDLEYVKSYDWDLNYNLQVTVHSVITKINDEVVLPLLSAICLKGQVYYTIGISPSEEMGIKTQDDIGKMHSFYRSKEVMAFGIYYIGDDTYKIKYTDGRETYSSMAVFIHKQDEMYLILFESKFEGAVPLMNSNIKKTFKDFNSIKTLYL